MYLKLLMLLIGGHSVGASWLC